MKKKFALLLTVLLAVGLLMKPSANAIELTVNVGDRPFYEGPSYWDSGYEFIWIAGHREHGHWVHGHYERHGEFRRAHAREHHHHHGHDRDHDHDRD